MKKARKRKKSDATSEPLKEVRELVEDRVCGSVSILLRLNALVESTHAPWQRTSLCRISARRNWTSLGRFSRAAGVANTLSTHVSPFAWYRTTDRKHILPLSTRPLPCWTHSWLCLGDDLLPNGRQTGFRNNACACGGGGSERNAPVPCQLTEWPVRNLFPLSRDQPRLRLPSATAVVL